MSFDLKLLPKLAWQQAPTIDPSTPADQVFKTPAAASYNTKEEAMAEVKRRWPSATTRSLGNGTYVFDKAFWDASWNVVPEGHRPPCAVVEEVVAQ